MARHYLSDFYTFRGAVSHDEPALNAATALLERQAHAHVLRGHRAFVQRRFGDALADYRAAWNLAPGFLAPLPRLAASPAEDLELLGLDLFDSLVSASVQILRLRESAGPEAQIVALREPPAALLELPSVGGQRLRSGQRSYALGLAHARAGELAVAARYATAAVGESRFAPDVQADAHTLVGIIAVVRGDPETGREQFLHAAKLYQRSSSADGIFATDYNLGVVAALSGDAQEAMERLSAAAVAPFLGVGWHVSRSTLPGVASFSLAIDPPGLPLVARAIDGQWVKVPSHRVALPKTAFHGMHAGTPMLVDLEHESEPSLVAALFEPRIRATTLAELAIDLNDLPMFVAGLAHVYGFVLPLALGDAYVALGDPGRAEAYFLKARDYRFLNTEIEKPVVWGRLADVYLQRGRQALRHGTLSEARRHFARLRPPGASNRSWVSSPLFSGAFADLGPTARAFLATDDPTAFSTLDYGSRIRLLKADSLLFRINHGLDGSGFPAEPITVAPWQSLQRAGNDATRTARQVETMYQRFAAESDRGEFTLASLELAATAQETAVQLAEQRVREAAEIHAVLRDGAAAAAARLQTIRGLPKRLDGNGSRAAKLAEMKHWIHTGREDGAVSPMAWRLSALPGDSGGATVPRRLAATRNQASPRQELAALQRQTRWIDTARAEAEAQTAIAERLLSDANRGLHLARLRRAQTQARVQFFDGANCTVEAAGLVRRELQDVCEACRDAALGAARQAHGAYTLEFGPRVQDQADDDRLERRMADRKLLLLDAEQPPDQRPAHVERRIPLRTTISLAERWPHQFASQFRDTGLLEFELALDEIDQLCPGACLARVRQVGIEIDAQGDLTRFRATLTKAGFALDRDRAGAVQLRTQRPESMMITSVVRGGPGSVLSDAGEPVPVAITPADAFAGAPVAGCWTIEVPREPANLDPRAISDIRVTFDMQAFYEPRIAALVGAETVADAVNEHAFGIQVKAQFPRDFSLLRTTGAVSFTIDPAAMPPGHADPRILDAYIVVDAGDTSPPGLVLGVASKAGALALSGRVDAGGAIGGDEASSPLNGLRGQPLCDRWTISFAREPNATSFAEGFRWDHIRDIHFLADYSYTPLPATAPRRFRWQRGASAPPAPTRP